MAKYDMTKKELFDIDPELSAEGKEVMRSLQGRYVWPQKDFLGLIQGIAPEQVEAVKDELEELGYVTDCVQYEMDGTKPEKELTIVTNWPSLRLYAAHDFTDLKTYKPGPIHDISELVDFLTKTMQLPVKDVLSRKNAYLFFDSVFAQLDEDETIQLALMGALEGGDVETRAFRERIGNTPRGAIIKTTKRIFTYYDDQSISYAEKGIFTTNVYDLETNKPHISTNLVKPGEIYILLDWGDAHESGDDGYCLQITAPDNSGADKFVCDLIAHSN